MPIGTMTTLVDGTVPVAADFNGNFNTLNTTTIPVASGGTNLTAGTSGGVLGFTASGTIASSAALAANGVVLGGGAGATPTATTAGSADQVLRVPSAGGAPAFGTAAVAGGGTGAATLTLNGVLYGNGTSAVQVTAQGGTRTILTANAGAPAWSAAPILNTSMQLGVVSSTTGSLILANSASANLTTIQAGNATAAVTYVWPTADGSNTQVLTTNGSGVLSWASAGIAAGDSPTWTGTHTWSSAGARIVLSNADSQIFMGAAATDPGWSVPAIYMKPSGQRGSAVFKPTTSEIYTSDNVYYDGGYKYDTTNQAGLYGMTGGTFQILTAASGTAGAAITWTTSLMVNNVGGVTVGTPTGGDKGTGTINLAADAYKNNTAYTNPDWVLELWATDDVVQYADRLAEFQRDSGLSVTRLLTLDETEQFARAHLHLPLIGRGPAGVFARSHMALATTEDLYRHVFDLNHRIQVLEAGRG